MKAQSIIPSWEDMVFEKRNKEYGAYIIRRIYSKHVVLATIVMFGIAGLVIAAPKLAELFKGSDDMVAEDDRLTTTVNLDQPPPITPNQPPPPKLDIPPPVKTIKYVAPKVTKEEVQEEEMPTIEELKQVEVISTTTQEGDNVVFEEPVVAVVQEPEEDKIFTVVEQSAEFPGGMGELYKFLNKNIRFPATARRMGVDGKVFVQFVVDKDGKINDIQIVKSLSEDCDKEAVRLIQLMPNWKPGKQNGRAVKQKYTLPIVFKLEV